MNVVTHAYVGVIFFFFTFPISIPLKVASNKFIPLRKIAKLEKQRQQEGR